MKLYAINRQNRWLICVLLNLLAGAMVSFFEISNPVFLFMVIQAFSVLFGGVYCGFFSGVAILGYCVCYFSESSTALSFSEENFARVLETMVYVVLMNFLLGCYYCQVEKRISQLEEANKELKQLCVLDGLTGIANRRFFDQMLKKEWGRCWREKKALSFLILDVDFFKRYNDIYGHPQGDLCLKRIAKAIQAKCFRSGDVVARYGGEEFTCLLPNTDEKGAKYVAETLRQEIEKLQIVHEGSDVSAYITVSVGVATQTPASQDAIKEMIMRADSALYQAKGNGRNQVSLYGEEYERTRKEIG